MRGVLATAIAGYRVFLHDVVAWLLATFIVRSDASMGIMIHVPRSRPTRNTWRGKDDAVLYLTRFQGNEFAVPKMDC